MKIPFPDTRNKISNALSKAKQALTSRFMKKTQEQTPAQTQRSLKKNPHLGRFLENAAEHRPTQQAQDLPDPLPETSQDSISLAMPPKRQPDQAEQERRANAALGIMPSSALFVNNPSSSNPTVQSPQISVAEQKLRKEQNNLGRGLKKIYPFDGEVSCQNGQNHINLNHIDALIFKLSNEDIKDVEEKVAEHKTYRQEKRGIYKGFIDDHDALNVAKNNHKERQTKIRSEIKTTQNLSPKDELIKHMQIAQRTKLISVIDKILQQKP